MPSKPRCNSDEYAESNPFETKLLKNMREVPQLPVESPCPCEDGDECKAVMVRFEWRRDWGGETVSLAGSFNGWEEVTSQASRFPFCKG